MTQDETLEFKAKHPSNYTYLLKHKHPETYSEIMEWAEKTGIEGVPFPQKLYNWTHGLTEVPKCEVCGKPCAFISLGKWEYSNFCGRLCARRGKSTLEKRKATTRAKYGVDFTTQAAEVKKKIKESVREKYGVDCTLQLDSVKEKIKETNLALRGVEYPMMSEEVKRKRVETYRERYGVESPLQSGEIRDKVVKTNLERYGATVSPAFIEALQERNIERRMTVYDEIPTRFPQVEILTPKEKFGGLNGENDWRCKICGKTFHTSGWSGSHPTCDCQHKSTQKEIFEFVKSLSDDAVMNFKPFEDDKREIDIYIPSMRIGIEFDGLYWHSELFRGFHYHADKTIDCMQIGIRVIHIFEDEWKNKNESVKNKIRNILTNPTLNITQVQSCEVREIEKSTAEKFININGLLTYPDEQKGILNLGLFHDALLVGVAVVKDDCNNKCTILCSETSHEINQCDAIPKFVDYISIIRPNSDIHIFVDLRLESCDTYEKLGFCLIDEIDPKPWFTKNFTDRTRNIATEFRGEVVKETTAEIARNCGFHTIWDCGSRIYRKPKE